MIFRKEIYALWAMVAGLLIGLNLFPSDMSLYLLLGIIVTLRLLSVHFDWQLPKLQFKQTNSSHYYKSYK